MFDFTSPGHYNAKSNYRVYGRFISNRSEAAEDTTEAKAAEGQAEREVLEDASDVDKAAHMSK
jgi:hypothetical protein